MNDKKFYKKIVNGFIASVAHVYGNFEGEEITEEEYNEIIDILNSYEPPDIPNKDYRLSSNLDWVLVDIDPINPSDITDEEAINLLLSAIDN